MDIDNFRKKLKSKKEGLPIDVSPLDFLRDINQQITEELEQSKVHIFKRNLSKNKKEIVESQINFILEPSVITEEVLLPYNDTIQTDSPSIENTEPTISLVTDYITKEEINKVHENYTNFFSEPDNATSKNLKKIQTKLKYLETWLSKISLAGQGSGEVNFRWLDDVNRNTIGNTDQILRYNPIDKKFFKQRHYCSCLEFYIIHGHRRIF